MHHFSGFLLRPSNPPKVKFSESNNGMKKAKVKNRKESCANEYNS